MIDQIHMLFHYQSKCKYNFFGMGWHCDSYMANYGRVQDPPLRLRLLGYCQERLIY